MRTYTKIFLFLAIVVLSGCYEKPGVGHRADNYYVRVISPDKVRMFCSVDSTGASFAFVNKNLPHGEKMAVAMNGGMFIDKATPVGLYIEDGVLKHRISQPGNSGNYNMGFGSEKVNGIFLVDWHGRASVVKSKDYIKPDSIRYATQSGPILVYNGEINPNFTEGSKNILSRNGIGVDDEGNVVMIYSPKTNFYDMARIFQDTYHCKNALYLDGVVSRMYLPECGLKDQSDCFAVVVYGVD